MDERKVVELVDTKNRKLIIGSQQLFKFFHTFLFHNQYFSIPGSSKCLGFKSLSKPGSSSAINPIKLKKNKHDQKARTEPGVSRSLRF